MRSFRRLQILEIVFRHRVEQIRLRIVEGIQLDDLVGHFRRFLPVLGADFEQRDLQIGRHILSIGFDRLLIDLRAISI